MADHPLVLILSSDELFRELLAERFRQDYLETYEAATLSAARAVCAEHAPNVVVVDAISDGHLMAGILDDPHAVFEDAEPPLMLLAGSATPDSVRNHGFIDRVVAVPLSSDKLVEAAVHCARGRARRAMMSGVRLRSAVTETFKTKTGSVASGS